MKFHEYANIYRMLPEIELAKLAEDIKTKGQLLPITSYEGQVLDGRNRYKACEIAGVEPRIEEYTGDDPLGLIASLNDHRRHDDPTERALVGDRMANLKAHRPVSVTSPRGLVKPAVTMARAAELAGTSPSQIKRVRKAKREGIPELVDMLESGDINPATAERVASLPKEDQRQAVNGGVAGVKEAAKKLVSQKSSTTHSERSNGSGLSTSQDENTPAEKPKRPPNYIPSDAMDIWNVAKTHLDRILKNDIHREQALKEVIEYCQNRISNKK